MFAFAHEIKSGRIIENETTGRAERTKWVGERESKMGVQVPSFLSGMA